MYSLGTCYISSCEKESIFNNEKFSKVKKCLYSNIEDPKKIEALHNALNGSVKVYRGFETAWNFTPTRVVVPHHWHTGIINFYSKFNGTFHCFDTLSSIGIIVNINYIIRHFKDLKRNTKLLRFDAAMHILRALGYLFENIAWTLSGMEGLKWAANLEKRNCAFLASVTKTATAYATTFLTIGTLLSITDIVIHARKWKKTDECYKDFIDHSGYREDGNYNNRNYEVFLNYIQQKSAKELKQSFLIDGNLLRAKFLSIETPIEQTANNYKQLNSILSKLKTRLQSCKTTYAVSLISETSNLLSKALIISGLFHPFGFFLLGIFTIGSFSVFVQKKLSAYAFENEIGLILRPSPQLITPKTSLKERIKDFALWFFGFHKYIPIPRIAMFRFNRKAKSLLPLTNKDPF